MDKETFQSLCKLAGFKKKNELAKALGLSYGSVNAWGNTKPYPHYLRLLLESMIKARAYDEAIKRGFIPQELDFSSAGVTSV